MLIVYVKKIRRIGYVSDFRRNVYVCYAMRESEQFVAGGADEMRAGQIASAAMIVAAVAVAASFALMVDFTDDRSKAG